MSEMDVLQFEMDMAEKKKVQKAIRQLEVISASNAAFRFYLNECEEHSNMRDLMMGRTDEVLEALAVLAEQIIDANPDSHIYLHDTDGRMCIVSSGEKVKQ